MQTLIVILIVCFGIQMVFGVAEECYSCEGDGCRDEFNENNAGVLKITAVDGWCTKVSGKLLGQTDITQRGPASRDVCITNDCDRLTYQNNDYDFCCCNKNLCNAAARIHAMTAIIILLISTFASAWMKNSD